MVDREPGPLPLLEPTALQPFPSRPSFASLVTDALAHLPGADLRLATAAATIASGASDLPDGFESALAAAASDVSTPPGAEVFRELADDIARGDNGDLLRQSVQDVLPPADAPIEMQFEAPPPPPRVEPRGKPVPPFEEPIQESAR